MVNVEFIEDTLLTKPVTVGNPQRFDVAGFSIDSREIEAGQCFIAIRGDKFDGHTFVAGAAEKGVECFIVESSMVNEVSPKIANGYIFPVTDTVAALGQLARRYKDYIFSIAIAITGSAGKTTSRQLITKILMKKYNVHTAKKNLNNQIGLPLVMLEAKSDTHIMALELGMNHTGEIEYLVNICEPLVGLITNIGYAHIGNMGSLEAIADAKSELFSGMNKRGFVFLNRDDPFFSYLKAKCPVTVVEFGEEDIHIVEDLGLAGYKIEYQGQEFLFPLPGRHNLANLCGGLKVGEFFAVTLTDRISAVGEFVAVSGRSEIIPNTRCTLINDCYNANPSSMIAALRVLGGSTMSGKRIAVLSDMLELGDQTTYYHRMVGDYIVQNRSADLVLGYGEQTAQLMEVLKAAGIECVWVESLDKLIELTVKSISPQDVVLVKASHGMHLDEVVKAILEA